MESKEAISSTVAVPFPGSSPSSSSYSSYDSTMTKSVPETNSITDNNAENDVKIDNYSNSKSVSSDNASSESVEEEFEPASDKPVSDDLGEEIVEKGTGEDNPIDPFVSSLDNSKPQVENLEVSNVLVDDVEKVNKVIVSEELMEYGGDGRSEVGNGGTDRGQFDAGNSKMTGVEDFESETIVPVDFENSDLNSNEVGQRSIEVLDDEIQAVESGGGNEEAKDLDLGAEGEDSRTAERELEETNLKIGEGAREVEKGEVPEDKTGNEGAKDLDLGAKGEDSRTAERELEETNVKIGEGAREVEKGEVPEDKTMTTEQNDEEFLEKLKKNAEGGQVDIVSNKHDEPVDCKLVEVDGVKLTSEGDSVVEAIKVETPLLKQGVAIVGEVEEGGSMPSNGLEFSGNEIDARIEAIEEVVNKETIEVDNKTLVPAVDDDVKTSESNSIEQTTDVAVAGNDQEFDQEDTEDDSDGRGGILETNNNEKKQEEDTEQAAISETKENGTLKSIEIDGKVDEGGVQDGKFASPTFNLEKELVRPSIIDDKVEDTVLDESDRLESVPGTKVGQLEILEAEDESSSEMDEVNFEGSISDGETEGVIFGSSEAAKHFIEELEHGSEGDTHSGADNYRNGLQNMDGQIVTDSDEEVDRDEEGDGKELFDSAALAALLKAATGADHDGGSITITSQDGSRIFSIDQPAGLGSSIRSLRPTPRSNRPSLFAPATLSSSTENGDNLNEEEKKKLEKLQDIRVKYLRLIQRLGLSTDESIAAQVLYRLSLVAGRQSNQYFNSDAAKRMALQLEEGGVEDLDFSLNILVIGKCGTGKSATINSIFGEDKATINAFEPSSSTVKEISGFVDGAKIRVFDTPGLKPSVMEQSFNRRVLSSVKKLIKKTPPDIVLYVDRLDAPTRDLNDLPLLKTVTSSLGTSTWRNAIVTLTHASSAPPDGPSGSPLSYEVFVTQRSNVVQHLIGQAVGDLRMMSPSLMNPVALVENHTSCRKNREGQKVLPNGQSWRQRLLLLCYSMKISSEASSLSKPQDPFDHRKIFGFRARSPPLPYMLSTMLQSRPHPKLSTEQGGDNGDSDIDSDDLSDIEQEEGDEYDQLPPFKPLKKAQLAKLSNEQRKAYFDEYDYRVKLLQKKQWRDELRRMREMKTKGKDAAMDYGYAEEDAESGAGAAVAVPLPDMALPPSFDSDNPAYRYRFLEPTSQFLARPVLDTHGWDHDCGYDGVNLEHSLAIASCFPAQYTIQISKDKKDFTINLDSAISAKHGENGSSMAGFDIQSIGKQLAYIVRGETKFKNLKKNKTTGGISVTFLGENVVTGAKIEDQITIGKQYVLTGSAGVVRSQHDTAYGANFELQRRELDYPIGQVQSTLSMSVLKWRGDLALGFNSLAQFSVGRSSKVAVRAGINNKLSGQITVRTSSSEHLSLALAAIVPTAIAIYRKLWPDGSEKYSIY